MEGDQFVASEKKLCKAAFYIASNGLLGKTVLAGWINNLEHKMQVSEDGNMMPSVIGAIYLILHSSLGTEFIHPSERVGIRKLMEFLDPYLEERYRPQSEEPAPAIYLIGR